MSPDHLSPEAMKPHHWESGFGLQKGRWSLLRSSFILPTASAVILPSLITLSKDFCAIPAVLLGWDCVSFLTGLGTDALESLRFRGPVRSEHRHILLW